MPTLVFLASAIGQHSASIVLGFRHKGKKGKVVVSSQPANCRYSAVAAIPSSK